MSGIYHSYFDTVSTTRKSPTKRSSPAKKQQEPPKKLSKAFTRQLEKTLSTTSTKKRKGAVKKQSSTKRKRAPTSAKMPKRPAAPEETYDSDGGFVEDAEPKSKKSKHSASSSSKTSKKNVAGSAPATMEKDNDGGVYWSIANKRRVQLTEFKGTLMVGIREFYEKDGEMLPGKKGISMTLEQFDAVLGVLPELEREVRKRGGKVRKVMVEGEKGEKDEKEEGVVGEEDGGEEEKEDEEEEEEEELPKKTKNKLEKFKHKAKNHEATSDEDED